MEPRTQADLRAQDRPQAALAAYDAALAKAPRDVQLLIGKAGLLEGLARPDEAAALYEEAAAIAPAAFEPAFRLARLALEAGDWAAAERWDARLGAAFGEIPPRLWLAARIALGRGDLDAAQAKLDRLLADPGLAPDARAEALLTRAQALDAASRPAEAFAAAAEGKALLRRANAARAASREGVVARFQRLRAEFAAADPADWTAPEPVVPSADEPRLHVFLTGFPRSGTTLLEQALAGHPDVVALEEAPTLADAHGAFMGGDAGLARLARLPAAERARWRAEYWAAVRAHGVEPAGRVFVDKAPAGADDLALVARLFPEARVLFALRDPRDVALSCFTNAFQMNALTYAFTDLTETARAYDASMALAETYRQLLPLAWRDVRHEALVADFEGELRAICGFIGLAWDGRVLDVAATARGRAVRTPSAPQVRAGLTRERLGRWQAYADELAPALSILKPWIERFGYA